MRSCQMFISMAFLFLASAPSIHAQDGIQARRKRILDEILAPNNYDKRIRPPGGTNGTDGPLGVKVNMMFRDIERIDDMNQEWSVQLTFRAKWKDVRLKYDNLGGRIKYLSLTDVDHVWIPDFFFKNERSGHTHNIITPNRYLRISPDGEVLHSIRVSLTLYCPMVLKRFPMDEQMCNLMLASYGHTTDDIVFLWFDNDPVQITKNVNLPRFSLMAFQADYCNTITHTGVYSCLRVDMLFNRDFSYYGLVVYTPCFMMVVVSYLCFWLDRKDLTARIILASLTLFVLSLKVGNINQLLPPVSYTKAIDVWTGICVTFVFGALMEVALVHYILLWDKGTSELANPSGETHGKVSRFTEIGRKIDVYSRILFPVAFVLFNVGYWPTYLNVESDIAFFKENATWVYG